MTSRNWPNEFVRACATIRHRARTRNAADFLPELRILPLSWGGPPGPRGTPPSRIRNKGISTLQGARTPTGASAADRGVRPTISADCSLPTKSLRHAGVRAPHLPAGKCDVVLALALSLLLGWPLGAQAAQTQPPPAQTKTPAVALFDADDAVQWRVWTREPGWQVIAPPGTPAPDI